MEQIKSLINLPCYVQCTYANAFAEPIFNRGYCCISYDIRNGNRMFKHGQISSRVPVDDMQIGYLTGERFVDDSGMVWLRSELLYCNRLQYGWFREITIQFSMKGVYDQIIPDPVNPDPENHDTETPKKSKTNILLWVLGGIALTRILKD